MKSKNPLKTGPAPLGILKCAAHRSFSVLDLTFIIYLFACTCLRKLLGSHLIGVVERSQGKWRARWEERNGSPVLPQDSDGS